MRGYLSFEFSWMNVVSRQAVDTLKVLVHELLGSETVAVGTHHAQVSTTRTIALVDVPLVNHLKALRALDAGRSVGTETLGRGETTVALFTVVL